MFNISIAICRTELSITLLKELHYIDDATLDALRPPRLRKQTRNRHKEDRGGVGDRILVPILGAVDAGVGVTPAKSFAKARRHVQRHTIICRKRHMIVCFFVGLLASEYIARSVGTREGSRSQVCHPPCANTAFTWPHMLQCQNSGRLPFTSAMEIL